MRRYANYIVLGIVALLVQWLILGRMELWGAYPDLVMLAAAWIGLKRGRRTGAIGGFLLGVVMDAIYDTWGLHMFLKTLLGFLIGFLTPGERESLHIVPRQALLGGFTTGLVHNGLLVAFLGLQTGTLTGSMIGSLWVGSALYSAFVATLLSLLIGR